MSQKFRKNKKKLKEIEDKFNALSSQFQDHMKKWGIDSLSSDQGDLLELGKHENVVLQEQYNIGRGMFNELMGIKAAYLTIKGIVTVDQVKNAISG